MPKTKPTHGGKRPGAGRPPLGASARAEIVRLRLSAADRRRWQALADQQGITLSEMIREAVELAIALPSDSTPIQPPHRMSTAADRARCS